MRRPTTWLLALLAVIVLVAACSKAPSDAALANNIKGQMFSDPQLKDSNLQVSVINGEATLSGTVPSDAARYEAFKLATNTPGVKKVNDQMTVQVAQAAPAAAPTPEQAPAPPAHRVRRARIRHSSPAPEPIESQPAPPPAPAPAAASPPPPPQPQPREVEIPARTTVTIRMVDSVDSSINHVGEVFLASLDAPLVADNEVIVPKGANVYVRLVQASSAGHMTGRSELRLELVKLDFQGHSYPLVSSTYDIAGTSRGKRTAATVGGGAAIGALIGAIAGGGKGAAIGAGVGAGSAGVYQGVTKGKQVRIPSETRLDFQLEQPLTITYLPRSGNAGR